MYAASGTGTVQVSDATLARLLRPTKPPGECVRSHINSDVQMPVLYAQSDASSASAGR
ncbi:hypothetical protein WC5_02700 [Escherichia sp. KTE114]|nr:hypothetical protein WC5_02700 [Escherichia sp. KTE114]